MPVRLLLRNDECQAKVRIAAPGLTACPVKAGTVTLLPQGKLEPGLYQRYSCAQAAGRGTPPRWVERVPEQGPVPWCCCALWGGVWRSAGERSPLLWATSPDLSPCRLFVHARACPCFGRPQGASQRNQRDGGDGGRRAEGAARGAWLAPDLRDARGAIFRCAFALGDARALRALKNCGGRSRDCAERLSSLWAVSGGLSLLGTVP
ncbi:hypothetical protein NDU88_000862 [Pleurodeles waltl]|uniref:Uncharacterized protein n=1 Tax=Pleurodeles waltl TaxID=8319 RepID=A0AAV7S995_PLEWA|nr:hypothetical protein NDU88_000862 [Pleurodeles waltl]